MPPSKGLPPLISHCTNHILHLLPISRCHLPSYRRKKPTLYYIHNTLLTLPITLPNSIFQLYHVPRPKLTFTGGIPPPILTCCCDRLARRAKRYLFIRSNEIMRTLHAALFNLSIIFSRYIFYTMSNHENKNSVCMFKYLPLLTIIIPQSKLGPGRLRPWHDCPKTSYRRNKVKSVAQKCEENDCSKTRFKRHKTKHRPAIEGKLSRMTIPSGKGRITRVKTDRPRPWHDGTKTSYRRNKNDKRTKNRKPALKASYDSWAKAEKKEGEKLIQIKYKINNTPQVSARLEPIPHSIGTATPSPIPLGYPITQRIVGIYINIFNPVNKTTRKNHLPQQHNYIWHKYCRCHTYFYNDCNVETGWFVSIAGQTTTLTNKEDKYIGIYTTQKLVVNTTTHDPIHGEKSNLLTGTGYGDPIRILYHPNGG